MKNGFVSGVQNRGRPVKKKVGIEDLVQNTERKDKEECRKTPSNTNLNKIRYKVNSHKR